MKMYRTYHHIQMSGRLRYSFVYSDDERKSLYYLVRYSMNLCRDNNVDIDRVPMVLYQLSNALADGKIVGSDIEFSTDRGITNISSVSINQSGAIICDIGT